MKQYVKEVPVELYRRGVLVFIGSHTQLRNYIALKYPCYSDDVNCMFEELPRGSAWTVKLEDDALIYAEDIISEDVMIHEIFHTTHHLLSLVNVHDEEAAAYLMEYLCGRILPWLRAISSSPVSQ